jgi:hypothetical protein
VRAKFVQQRIRAGQPIPNIPDPGAPLTPYQEEQLRLQAGDRYDSERNRVLKEIREQGYEIEKAISKWEKDKATHDEKVAKCSKVFSTKLGEGVLADVRDQLDQNHFRTAWKYLEVRSLAMEVAGEGQMTLMNQLKELKWLRGTPLSVLYEEFNDLTELCKIVDPMHRMTYFRDCFSKCSIKEYQDALLNQKNLNQSLEQLKDRLLAEEASINLRNPGLLRPIKRPFSPNESANHERKQKPVSLNAVKPTQDDSRRATCDHCGKTGHSADKCWTAHPELRPAKGSRAYVAAGQSESDARPKVIKDAHDLVKSAKKNKSQTRK